MSGETIEQEDLSWRNILPILRRRKWLILGGLLAGLLGAVGWNLAATPIYEATATLQIGPPPFASFMSGEQPGHLGWMLTPQPFDSEIQVLKSRTLAEDALKRLRSGSPLEGDQLAQVVNDLRGRITAHMITGTSIMAVRVRSSVADAATREANTLSEAYIAYTIRRRTSALSSAEEFISRQLELVTQKLRTMQERLKGYQAKYRTPTVASEAILKKVFTADVEKAKIEAARKEVEALLDFLTQPKRGGSYGPFFMTETIRNEALSNLTRRLGALESQRMALKRTYTEQHPDLISLEAQIKDLKSRLIQETEVTVAVLKERERNLAGVLDQYETELRSRPGEDLDVMELLRAAKVTDEMYAFFLKKQEEARLAVGSQVGDARILDRALPSRVPILPNTRRNLLLGVILGLGLGLGLAYMSERADRSVRSIEDVEKGAGLPVFGAIPVIAASHTAGGKKGHQRRRVYPLVARMEQRSLASEAYRSLRTSIQFATLEVSAKCFALTSPGPGEGKSLTAANLAITLAELGGRILLVDADLRNPVLHSLFRVPRGAGLTDLLAGQLEWQDRVRLTEVNNLELLPSGPIPPNPPTILGSNRMKLLLQELVRHYDVVLIDTPPVLPITDAVILSSMVDGVFLVARAGITTPEALLRARTLLHAANVRVLGVILNALRLEDTVDGYGYSRSRYYGYYYGHGTQGADPQNRWFTRLKRWDPRR